MGERVCAVVVTYNRCGLLRECLQALRKQTRAVETVLVVNNASTDDTRKVLAEEFPEVEVLDLAENGGGAGGFHAGMKQAYEQGFDWLWVMDDDGRPAPNCLEKMLAQSRPGSVLVPLQQDKLGGTYGICIWNGSPIDVTADVLAQKRPLSGDYVFSFVGPLLSRKIVEKIGLPIKEFFIGFDDWEYALRIKRKTDAEIIVVPDALFFHDFGNGARNTKILWRKSVRIAPAPWKLYYGARNPTYTLVNCGRPAKELLWYLLFQSRCMLGEIVFESDRWQRVWMRLKGIHDGALGRLGKRV